MRKFILILACVCFAVSIDICIGASIDISSGTLSINGFSTSELVLNGGMEFDVAWIDYYTPTTNERSAEQAHSGSYSRKIVGNSTGDGLKSEYPFGTLAGAWYDLSYWVYPSRDVSIRHLVRYGDDSGWSVVNVTPVLGNQWNYVNHVPFQDIHPGAGAYIVIYTTEGTEVTFYVDDVTIQAIAVVVDVN